MEIDLHDIAGTIQPVMERIGATFERQVREQFGNPAIDRGHYSDAQKVASFISVQAERDASEDALDFDMGVQCEDDRLQFFSSATDLEGGTWADFGLAQLDAAQVTAKPSMLDPLIRQAAAAMREYMDRWLLAHQQPRADGATPASAERVVAPP